MIRHSLLTQGTCAHLFDVWVDMLYLFIKDLGHQVLHLIRSTYHSCSPEVGHGSSPPVPLFSAIQALGAGDESLSNGEAELQLLKISRIQWT